MKVYQKSCNNCLLSSDSIVSPESRKQILQNCARDQSHFICHKASMQGDDVCCKTFYDKLGHLSQLVRIAKALDVVTLVEQPEHEKPPTYREMNS